MCSSVFDTVAWESLFEPKLFTTCWNWNRTITVHEQKISCKQRKLQNKTNQPPSVTETAARPHKQNTTMVILYSWQPFLLSNERLQDVCYLQIILHVQDDLWRDTSFCQPLFCNKLSGFIRLSHLSHFPVGLESVQLPYASSTSHWYEMFYHWSWVTNQIGIVLSKPTVQPRTSSQISNSECGKMSFVSVIF